MLLKIKKLFQVFLCVVFTVCYSAVRCPILSISNMLNIIDKVLTQKQIHWRLFHEKFSKFVTTF